MNHEVTILWVDDEIDLLKPQILFLKEKGYSIIEASNGHDAVELCRTHYPDIVFLDEQMPGRSGLETLSAIKALRPHVPVVMITKSEEEHLMEEAIGSQISDYLIKPVKPQQVLLTLKKLLDNRRLVTEKTTSEYQKRFQQFLARIHMGLNAREWAELYRQLVYWELELDQARNDAMLEVLALQKAEANTEFCKFIVRNYKQWMQKPDEQTPTLSHTLLARKVFPHLQAGTSTFLVVIDNLRYDQWKVIEPELNAVFRIADEDTFYSILPTSTHYSRNALFAGLMPLDIERRFPHLWRNDEDEGGKNLFEKEFLTDHLSRRRLSLRMSYTKITNYDDGRQLVDNILNLLHNDLNVIVYNFVDMLSHARTEMDVLKELASDETAYRSITRSWFMHSPLWEALTRVSKHPVQLFITTDHGTIRVKEPVKVIGDRDTTTNLRYKHGRNLKYDPRDVLETRNPHELMLPRPHVSSTFIFIKENKFFVYPNNYNFHVGLYKNTFQHGGISMEEMIVPIVRLLPA
ncbi:MAG: PglZ domain-containing protein [Chitinophagales bacterium]|nr:PglZ domain-containing protein [Chitinophagales bacterium]MDW8427515.1 PglZ domain-containing protein [Chitinophagales bacterium]